jgi:16S rRNA (cytosine1402-N4)-methyltransferase
MDSHYPVMLSEVLEYLALKPGGVYADCTTGLGGHSLGIAQRLDGGKLISMDRDGESLEMARENMREVAAKVDFAQSRFSQLKETLSGLGVSVLDGLVADFGVSRYQLTNAERGFSLMADGPLDMRMDRAEGPNAHEIVNLFEESMIADLIYQLGEERMARRIARAIVRARPVTSTLGLARVVESVVFRTGKLHPATRTFMALRMYVNRELEEVEALLDGVEGLIKPGGRMVTITFHSMEDRIVKRRFQQWAREGKVRVLTKHVVTPSDEELRVNAPSRSAKLRAVEFEG